MTKWRDETVLFGRQLGYTVSRRVTPGEPRRPISRQRVDVVGFTRIGGHGEDKDDGLAAWKLGYFVSSRATPGEPSVYLVNAATLLRTHQALPHLVSHEVNVGEEHTWISSM
jgi:hypothetical protein